MAKPDPVTHEDGLNDDIIDVFRKRLFTKEQNDLQKNKKKGKRGLNTSSITGASEKEKEVKYQYTYDDEGNIIPVKVANVERLPSLIGQGMSADVSQGVHTDAQRKRLAKKKTVANMIN